MPGPKANNRRKHADANHQPRHKAAERVGRAQARQEFSDSLTIEQKIARLPPEPYSQKERARLLRLLEKQSQPKQEAPVMVKGDLNMIAADTSPKQNQSKQKKYMKGSK